MRFYQNLLGKRTGLSKPIPKAEALDEAKRWLRSLTADQTDRELAALSRGDVRQPAKVEKRTVAGAEPHPQPNQVADTRMTTRISGRRSSWWVIRIEGLMGSISCSTKSWFRCSWRCFSRPASWIWSAAWRQDHRPINHPEWRTDDDLDTAAGYNKQAMKLKALGKYAQAEPLLEKSLEIRRHMLGDNHPDTATSYNNLALNQSKQGKFTQAQSCTKIAGDSPPRAWRQPPRHRHQL